MSSANHQVPFLTRGIGYRNDFQNTGSITIGITANAVNPTFYTDGDILYLQSSSTDSVSSIVDFNLSLSGSPIQAPYIFFGIRHKTGSNIGSIQFNLYSGSSGTGFNIANTGSFTFSSGSTSVAGTNNYIDRIAFRLNAITSGSIGIGLIDFVMFYVENIPLKYINNPTNYRLKRRIIELEAPMREQGIIQSLGSQSPTVDLNGVIVSDLDFTAQQYRNKLVDVWSEGAYQWLQTDFINYKFTPEDLDIQQLPGVINYYAFKLKLRQYTVISASSGSYNLA